MRKFTFSLFLVLIVAVQGYAAECDCSKEVDDALVTSANMVAARDAQIFLYALENLRDGDQECVEELFEHFLDQIIVRFDTHPGWLSKGQKKYTMETLAKIKEYRERYKRNVTIKVKAEDVSELLDTFDYEMTEQAKKALEIY